jgi:hypothetical protein
VDNLTALLNSILVEEGVNRSDEQVKARIFQIMEWEPHPHPHPQDPNHPSVEEEIREAEWIVRDLLGNGHRSGVYKEVKRSFNEEPYF